MKKFIFIIALLVPTFLWGQIQRLGILPAEINLFEGGTALVSTFCSDGWTRGIHDVPDEYRYFQSPEDIEVKVDGQVYNGGLPKLISDGDIIVNNHSFNSLEFSISQSSKFKNVSINFKRPNLVTNIEGDFKIEKYWLDILYKLNVLPENVTKFKDASPYISGFQNDYGLSASGLLTNETRDELESIKYLFSELQQQNIIPENVKNLRDAEPYIKEFQRINGITPTGKLTKETGTAAEDVEFWIPQLKKGKIIPENVKFLNDAAPYIKEFQRNNGLTDLSGKLTEETKIAVEDLVYWIPRLQKQNFLPKNIKNLVDAKSHIIDFQKNCGLEMSGELSSETKTMIEIVDALKTTGYLKDIKGAEGVNNAIKKIKHDYSLYDNYEIIDIAGILKDPNFKPVYKRIIFDQSYPNEKNILNRNLPYIYEEFDYFGFQSAEIKANDKAHNTHSIIFHTKTGIHKVELYNNSHTSILKVKTLTVG